MGPAPRHLTSSAPLFQMVGIGTSDVDLDKYHHTFCSLLGRDEDSWGLSYTGGYCLGCGRGRQCHRPPRLTHLLSQASSITKATR